MTSSKFQIGDRVGLYNREGNPIVGVVIAINNHPRTVYIKADGHSHWKYVEDLTLIQSAIDKLDDIL